MANYIRNEILCEAYTHLDIDVYQDKEALQKLKNELLPFFTERAKFLLGKDVTVEIEFDEGSLKTRLKVLGSAGLLVLGGIAEYGSIRQGFNQLADDSTILAQSANLEVIFRTKTAYCDRVQVEKRKGVFGRVSDLLHQLDNIKAELSSEKLPTNTQATQKVDRAIANLIEWEKRAALLFEKLDSDITKGCVAAGFAEELEKFPKKPLWATEFASDSFRSRMAKSDPELATELAAVLARFETGVRVIRKQMLDRVKEYQPKNA